MTSRWLRRLLNVYPPYLGAGVRVTALAEDFRFARVEMPLRWYNRNYVGTHFGGSLYSMVDPFLMLMLMRNLGPDYLVWDQAGSIEFVAPGRGTVWAEFRIRAEQLEAVRRATAGGQKASPWYEVEIKALDGSLVARVKKQIYVRVKEQARATAPR